uniref:Uncharacterized protein n=1 Tax=Solibacter usitatus (strain Ellin6076) TaxID=234267 RepID=Q01X03_SOLUE
MASGPDRGTNFRVFWPASGTSAKTYFTAAAASTAPYYRSRGTVLVVEDEDGDRSGRQLGAPSGSVAEEAGRVRPYAKVPLASAYSPEMAGPVGEARQVRGFIRKPFRLRDLVELWRETLSSRPQEKNQHDDHEYCVQADIDPHHTAQAPRTHSPPPYLGWMHRR